jgi:tetratricopeptide (TPR) repeat protein
MTTSPASATSPAEAEANLQHAVALHRGGMLAEAAAFYARILAAAPHHVDALHLLGVVRHQQGRNDEALPLIGAALEFAPRNVAILSNYGLVLSALGRHDEAVAAFDRALALDPNHAAALNNRAADLNELERYDEALASSGRALAIAPDFADAHCNRGIVLLKLERAPEALASFDKAISIDPAHARAHSNRGAALQALERFEDAIASCDRAIALRRDYAGAFHNRALALIELGRHDEALAAFHQVLAADPGHSAARWHEALLRLLRGKYAAGWDGYEWRFKHKEIGLRPRNFSVPQWHGEPVAGRTILLHAEQGFGDTIQFARYTPMVAARGARVVLEVQPALVSLIASLPGTATIIARGDLLPAFDVHCPMPSLPLAFATRLETIPVQTSYLEAPANRIAQWRLRLTPGAPRVGLVWSGNPRHKNDRSRSLPFDTLAPLIGVAGIDFVSLQKEPRPADAEALARYGNVLDLGPELQDFGDTAAVISLLDLVITVDTSIAHLAGALGKPVWIMLPTRVDWRWLLDREDSPWYPTARLFRQRAAGDWAGVIARVRQELVSRFAKED